MANPNSKLEKITGPQRCRMRSAEQRYCTWIGEPNLEAQRDSQPKSPLEKKCMLPFVYVTVDLYICGLQKWHLCNFWIGNPPKVPTPDKPPEFPYPYSSL